MKSCNRSLDPWLQIVKDIRITYRGSVARNNANEAPSTSEVQPGPRTSVLDRGRVANHEPVTPCVRIHVLERKERVVTIAWHDPTSCHYDDQLWHRCAAPRNGVCALSGDEILRGADIFRPWRRKSMPANAHAMILTSALPEVRSVDGA